MKNNPNIGPVPSDEEPSDFSGSAGLIGNPHRAQRAPASPEASTLDREAVSRPVAEAESPGSAGGWRHTFSSLDNREFRFLWLGMLFMSGGMQMDFMAMGYLVYDLTSSPFILGLVEASAALTVLTLGLFGGAFADRVQHKLLIQSAQVTLVVVALFIASSIATESVTWFHMLAASMVHGALFSFMMPARLAIIPRLVGQERLTNAMALYAAAMGGTSMLAPAVAGGLYVLIGPQGVYFVIAAMHIVAIGFTVLIPNADGGASKPSEPVIRDILAGLTYIRGNPLVLVLLVVGLLTMILVFPFRVMIPVFVVDIYHRGPEAMGLMVAVMGLGSLAGSLFVASLREGRRGLILIISIFMAAFALLLVALVPIYFAAVGFMLLLGLGDAGRRTLNQALIMEETAEAYRGRIMSVFMMHFGLMPLGLLPAGVAAEFLGARVTIGIMAALLLVISVLVLATQRRLRVTP